MQKFLLLVCIAISSLLLSQKLQAQQYKLKQRTGVMGMNTETTIYVKGKRKRTEPGSMMGMPPAPTTIEQCDKQRIIHINDKKKLYYIESFAKETEEVIDEDAPKPKTTPAAKPAAAQTQKGGLITLWYTITDTGERKTMYGLTARHVWTYQKIKPSADACTMKDSIIIKTDGWYIDLPQWSCPVKYRPQYERMPGAKEKPDCQDRFVTRRKGKGKLGFALTETTTIIMAGMKQEMTTATETVEFSAAKLDSMLFEIPLGYTETKNEDDLTETMDVKIGGMNMDEMMKSMGIDPANMGAAKTETKQAGMIRIGVLAPTGDEQVNAGTLQTRMAAALMSGKVEGMAISNEGEAEKYNCDYILNTNFTRIKSGSKVGGLLKAVKNADPNAASQFNIQASLTLKSVTDGSIKTQPSVDGKYEGKIDEAAGKAVEEGCRAVLKGLK